MARPKKEYDSKTAQIVENLSAYIGNKDTANEILPEISKRDLNVNGLYRSEWQRGKALGKYKVQSAYMKMAASGKCWPATKHFLASQCGIIEPKEPLQESVETQQPNVVVRFTGKVVEKSTTKEIEH